MMHSRIRSWFGAIVIAVAPFALLGCGANDQPGVGLGGMTGIGGSNDASGSAGASGSGGAVGAAGAGGGCTASNTSAAPADGLIADFLTGAGGPDAGGIEIKGGIRVFGGGAVGGPGSPSYTISGGALDLMESAPATSAPQYVGAFLYFEGCVDASAFTGVQFTISGSFSGCALEYSTNDSAHELVGGDPHGTAALGSYSPQVELTAAQVTSLPTTIAIPFTGPGAPSGGSPAGLALDLAKLDSLLWQLNIPASAAAAGDAAIPTCTADVTIDDVKFYR